MLREHAGANSEAGHTDADGLHEDNVAPVRLSMPAAEPWYSIELLDAPAKVEG